jgi:hypothetical protein
LDTLKIAAIVLTVAGVLGLVFGGFTYTKQSHQTQIGPIELSVKDTQTINVPIWAGLGAIALGGVLLVLATRKR